MRMTLPDRMRAAILVEQHHELVVDEVRLPARLEPGQMLARVHVSGVCGSQIGEIDGVKGPDRFLPHLLGHEASATVLAVGNAVTRMRPGDAVVLHWRPASGAEAAPASYEWRGRPLNAGRVTTFNELAIVSENRATPVPADLDHSLAALLGCAVTTGLGVVSNDARVAAGESVVVLGAGGVGLCEVQGARLAAAGRIVAVDVHAERLALARRLGATDTVHAGSPQAPNAAALETTLRSLVGGDGADVVIENTGRVELIELAYRLSRARGRTVLVGVPPIDRPARIHTLPLHFGKVLTGSHGGQAVPDRDIPRCIELLGAGRLDLGAMIGESFPLDRVNEAVAATRSGSVAGRCLIAMQPHEGEGV